MELFRIIKLKKLASPRNIVHKITELWGGTSYYEVSQNMSKLLFKQQK